MQQETAASGAALLAALLAVLLVGVLIRYLFREHASGKVARTVVSGGTMRKSGRWELNEDDGSRLHLRSTFGRWGRAEGQLISPRFLLPMDGGVLVADSANDRLQVFSPSGVHQRTMLGSVPGHPTGLATDGTHMWVADSSNCSVQKLTMDGRQVCRVGSYGSGDEQFSGPEGLALCKGALFVADEGNHRVAMLDAATLAWRGSFGCRGTAPGQLMNPVGLTVIGTELYVRDTKNDRIQVFDVSGASGHGICGAFVRTFGERGSGPGQFTEPTGMAHDGRGRLIVSEAGARRVQVLTMQGEPLQVLPLPLAGRLYGICASAGKLFIADYAKHLIHVLEFKVERLPPTPPRTPADKLS